MSLDLSQIVDVSVYVQSAGASLQSFQGLIMGPSGTFIGTTARVRQYGLTALTDMITDGFNTSDPEWIAAQYYFESVGNPQGILIGYIGGSESVLTAVTDARAKSQAWYTVEVVGIGGDTDYTAVANYIQAANPSSLFLHTTSDTAVLNNTTGNLFQEWNAALLRRTMGLYSATAYGLCSFQGYVYGQTTDFNNSAYTADFKPLTGLTPDNITQTQASGIWGNSGNTYTTFGNQIPFLAKGSMMDGSWADSVIYLDRLTNQIQVNVFNLLTQSPKIPQTEAGMAQLRHACDIACQDSVSVGFIDGGGQAVWNGGQILNLNTGDRLPTGFLTQSQPVASQSQTQRNSRVSPAIYVAIKEAGAIQSVAIQVDVNL